MTEYMILTQKEAHSGHVVTIQHTTPLLLLLAAQGTPMLN